MNYRLASDVLEGQFGPCEIEVLYQDNAERLAAIKTLAGEVLEIAMTNFDGRGAEEFRDAHEAIIGGGAMGKTFRDLNIPFHREMKAIGKRALAENFTPLIDSSRPGTIIRANIYVGQSKTLYAQVTEVFSHKVKWPVSDFTPTHEDDKAIEAALVSLGSILSKVS